MPRADHPSMSTFPAIHLPAVPAAAEQPSDEQSRSVDPADAPNPLRPTGHAVADAVQHHRQLCELTRDELSFVLRQLGYDLSAEDIAAIEDRRREVTVDDLMGLAYALETTPVVMLSHIPIDLPGAEVPLATGLPSDVEQQELIEWMTGQTTLDLPTRTQWWRDKIQRLELRAAHLEEQLGGAYLDLKERGLSAPGTEGEVTADARSLHHRIHRCEYEITQTDLAIVFAEQHLNDLETAEDDQPES